MIASVILRAVSGFHMLITSINGNTNVTVSSVGDMYESDGIPSVQVYCPNSYVKHTNHLPQINVHSVISIQGTLYDSTADANTFQVHYYYPKRKRAWDPYPKMHELLVLGVQIDTNNGTWANFSIAAKLLLKPNVDLSQNVARILQVSYIQMHTWVHYQCVPVVFTGVVYKPSVAIDANLLSLLFVILGGVPVATVLAYSCFKHMKLKQQATYKDITDQVQNNQCTEEEIVHAESSVEEEQQPVVAQEDEIVMSVDTTTACQHYHDDIVHI